MAIFPTYDIFRRKEPTIRETILAGLSTDEWRAYKDVIPKGLKNVRASEELQLRRDNHRNAHLKVNYYFNCLAPLMFPAEYQQTRKELEVCYGKRVASEIFGENADNTGKSISTTKSIDGNKKIKSFTGYDSLYIDSIIRSPYVQNMIRADDQDENAVLFDEEDVINVLRSDFFKDNMEIGINKLKPGEEITPCGGYLIDSATNIPLKRFFPNQAFPCTDGSGEYIVGIKLFREYAQGSLNENNPSDRQTFEDYCKNIAVNNFNSKFMGGRYDLNDEEGVRQFTAEYNRMFGYNVFGDNFESHLLLKTFDNILKDIRTNEKMFPPLSWHNLAQLKDPSDIHQYLTSLIMSPQKLAFLMAKNSSRSNTKINNAEEETADMDVVDDDVSEDDEEYVADTHEVHTTKQASTPAMEKIQKHCNNLQKLLNGQNLKLVILDEDDDTMAINSLEEEEDDDISDLTSIDNNEIGEITSAPKEKKRSFPFRSYHSISSDTADVYITPSWCVASLYSHVLCFELELHVLDPCCGSLVVGDYLRDELCCPNVKSITETDLHPELHPRIANDTPVNFLDFNGKCRETDWIITNPPWGIKREILEKCYSLRCNFALLLPLTTLGTGFGKALFKAYGIRIHILSPTPKFFNNGKEKCVGCVAWFIHTVGMERVTEFSYMEKGN